LSAIISQQRFTELHPFASPDGFPTPRNLSASVAGLNDPLARAQCRNSPEASQLCRFSLRFSLLFTSFVMIEIRAIFGNELNNSYASPS
jgi:hypothetical protein